MDVVLCGLPFVYAYVNDLLVASSSPEEHLQHLRLLFEHLQEHGLIINADKCEFGVTSLEFLRHQIDNYGIQPWPSKVQAIVDFP